VLEGFIDCTNRVLALIKGFMPGSEWLDAGEAPTYLHSCIWTITSMCARLIGGCPSLQEVERPWAFPTWRAGLCNPAWLSSTAPKTWACLLLPS
jgi:hypothetical protein